MKEIDYSDRNVLQAYVSRPLFLKETITVTRSDGHRTIEPYFLYTGELKEYSGESFWIVHGPLLMAKSHFREMGGENWPREYTIMGDEYIPHSPYHSMVIPDKLDPEYKVYAFDSDTEGRDIIEKIKRLEDIPPIT